MPTGFSTSAVEDMLNGLGNPFFQLHFGDPGALGTSNVASGAPRMQGTLAPASGGSRTLGGPVDWPNPWASDPQTITHVSAWSDSTDGEFLFSLALTTGVKLTIGVTPRLNGLSVTLLTIAKD